MSDQLVHVRDKSTGEEGYIGAAWLDRWPDDFDVIDAPAAPAAPPAAPAQTAAQQSPGEPRSTGNPTQF